VVRVMDDRAVRTTRTRHLPRLPTRAEVAAQPRRPPLRSTHPVVVEDEPGGSNREDIAPRASQTPSRNRVVPLFIGDHAPRHSGEWCPPPHREPLAVELPTIRPGPKRAVFMEVHEAPS